MGELQPDDPEELSHPEWFREPSRGEHWLGAGLFTGCGLFFLLLFVAYRGWWFRWAMLGLGVMSVWRGLGHARRGCGKQSSLAEGKRQDPRIDTNLHE